MRPTLVPDIAQTDTQTRYTWNVLTVPQWPGKSPAALIKCLQDRPSKGLELCTGNKKTNDLWTHEPHTTWPLPGAGAGQNCWLRVPGGQKRVLSRSEVPCGERHCPGR